MAYLHRSSSTKLDYVFKVVLIGDSSVGKSQLVARFLKEEFSIDTKPTVGADLDTKILSIDDRIIMAEIWDTAGQERFHSIISAYYRHAIGAMLLYDITNRQSFDHVVRWLEELRRKVEKDIVIMLVGNKIDLEEIRAVPTEVAKEFAENENLFFMETSALESINVESAFMTVLTEICKLFPKKTLIPNDVESVDSPLLVVPGQKQQPAPQKGRCSCCCSSS